MPPSSGSGVGHELRVAAFLQADEPEDGGFNGFADGQEAVVLEKGGLLVSQGVGDLPAFFGGEDDAVECRVKDVVLSRLSALTPGPNMGRESRLYVMKRAGILRYDVELPAQGTE